MTPALSGSEGVGKIAVPDCILLKPGPLTEEEYDQIKLHPGRGADLLERSGEACLAPLAEVVHAHHERWDGTGYPLGLSGESIPLLSRIIAIVDVFEALTSDRPYRCAMSAEQAMSYLNEGAGSQFDPGLVPLFEQLYREGRLSFAAPAESLAAPPDVDAVPSLRGDAPPALRLLPGLD